MLHDIYLRPNCNPDIALHTIRGFCFCKLCKMTHVVSVVYAFLSSLSFGFLFLVSSVGKKVCFKSIFVLHCKDRFCIF